MNGTAYLHKTHLIYHSHSIFQFKIPFENMMMMILFWIPSMFWYDNQHNCGWMCLVTIITHSKKSSSAVLFFFFFCKITVTTRWLADYGLRTIIRKTRRVARKWQSLKIISSIRYTWDLHSICQRSWTYVLAYIQSIYLAANTWDKHRYSIRTQTIKNVVRMQTY